MVPKRKKCLVCQKTGSDANITFHRFPTNPAIKKRWLDALGLDPEDVPIYSLLCSTHFAKGDFVVAGTRTFLSSKAIPFLPSIRLFIHDPETDPVASAKGETISATRCSSETLAAPEICEFNQESDMPIITTNDKQDSETLSLVSFSMTLTASSPALSESPQKSPVQTPDLENIYTEHQYCINLQLQKRKRTPDVDTVKKKIGCLPSKSNVLHPRQPRQPAKQFQSVSDFKREDIEDPIKRDQYFTLINEAVKSQQTKIRCLQTKNRRMRNKLSSLRALTSHLKQKNLISEIAETTLNASLSQSAEDVASKRPTKANTCQS